MILNMVSGSEDEASSEGKDVEKEGDTKRDRRPEIGKTLNSYNIFVMSYHF